MLVIPAIDLKDGLCVRLRQGDFHQETVYSEDPAAIAQQWEKLGAKWLHLVDLNGAVEGQPRNISQVEAVLKAIAIPVQVGGGIRTIETVRLYFAHGVRRVVLGTAALQHVDLLKQACEEYPDRILVGIDARDGCVAIKGWTSVSRTRAIDLVDDLKGYRLAGMIYTDISRDGMLTGPNITALSEIVDRSPVPVIASGGVTCIEDLYAIKALGPRIMGAIVGKALYDGKLDLPQALKALGRC